MPKKMFKKSYSRLTSHIFCYDLETSSLNTDIAHVLECYGVVIDINTLCPKDDGVFGPVLVKPLGNDWSNVSEDALKKNGLIRSEVEEKGLDQEVFFDQFTAFLRKFQKSDKKWDALIPAGFNTKGYDDRIMQNMSIRYKYVDGDGYSKLFHPFHSFDLMDILRPFFFSSNELESYSLENVCSYFGLSTDKAHTAQADTDNCAKILCRFLKFYKELSPRYLPKFKDCFNEKTHN